MDTAKLFSNGKSQAVRLPKAYRFEGDEVYVKRVGNGVMLLPMPQTPEARLAFWQDWLESLAEWDGEVPDRDQPTEQQERDWSGLWE